MFDGESVNHPTDFVKKRLQDPLMFGSYNLKIS